MDIFKNKKGKYFIFLHSTGEKEGLYITPLGEAKSLEHRFFERAGSEAEQEITEEQAKKYQEYTNQEKEFGARREDFGTQRFLEEEYRERFTLEAAAGFRRHLHKHINEEKEKKRREILKRKF